MDVDELGLEATGNTATFSVERGGRAKSAFLAESFEKVDDILVANGVSTEPELVDSRRAMADPTFVYRSPAMISVWGRQPLSANG